MDVDEQPMLYFMTGDPRPTWKETEEILDDEGAVLMWLDKNDEGRVYGVQLIGDAAERVKDAVIESVARAMWEAPYL